jgi:hypothetical protein
MEMFNELRVSFSSTEPSQWPKVRRAMNACLVFVLALAAAPLTGCHSKASFDPALAGAFFPLHPDSSWTYRIIDKSQGATDIVTDRVAGRRHIEIVTNRGVGRAHLNARKVFGESVSEDSSLYGASKSPMLYVSEDGYINRVSGPDGRSWIVFEERGFLPQLLKPGLTWSNTLFPFGNLPGAFHAVQRHRSFFEAGDVVVPAGHFPGCIRIETEAVYRHSSSKEEGARRLRYLDWYAPNVGLVKTLVLQSGFFGSEIARVELLSFVDSRVKVASHWSKTESARDTTAP